MNIYEKNKEHGIHQNPENIGAPKW